MDADYYFAPSLKRMLGWMGKSDIPVDKTGIFSGSESRSGKEHVRTLLAGNIQLSVPLIGGNSVLKRCNLDWNSLMISPHGDWQRKHLGAWQAVYGKTPYFIHLYPELERVYRGHGEGSFSDFCIALNSIVYKYLKIDEIKDSAREMKLHNSDRFHQIQSEIRVGCSPILTIFDPLFRLGRDTAYLFL